MADVSVLDIRLYGQPIGTLTRIPSDRSLFAFNDDYLADENRPTLGLGFQDEMGALITDFRTYTNKVMPFFSNLLPEGQLRTYLAGRAGIKPAREFFLLWVLGADLPGAITITPADGEAWPPDAEDADTQHGGDRREHALRFSLAGVQLKFSAITSATGGLTIPARGVGGRWIVKLPSEKYSGVPENEYSMMTLARLMGMDVPATELVDVNTIGNLPKDVANLKDKALTIERFDRGLDQSNDSTAVHIEDFAQVFGLYPHDKYERASSMNIAAVIAAETDESDAREFVRRLTFNTLIGNADMHVKNWSLIYPDRRTARLAPAYDFLSTVAYIDDDEAALTYSRTKRFDQFNADELSHLAARARLPKALILETARETLALFHQHWQAEKNNLPLYEDVIKAIERHMKKIPLR